MKYVFMVILLLATILVAVGAHQYGVATARSKERTRIKTPVPTSSEEVTIRPAELDPLDAFYESAK